MTYHSTKVKLGQTGVQNRESCCGGPDVLFFKDCEIAQIFKLEETLNIQSKFNGRMFGA